MSEPSPDLLPEAETTIVTGGSGWFGRAYLQAIAAGGGPGLGPVARQGSVRVLVPSPTDVDPVIEVCPKALIHVGDIADPVCVARLFRDAAGASVVHAAGVIHPAKVVQFEKVNVRGTQAVLEAAERAGVRRVVHVSSNSPFGANPRPDDVFRHDEPYHPYLGYGESKMRAEVAVREAHGRGGVQTVVVRPPWFYGPWQPVRQTTFFRLVRTGRFPLVGDGEQRRSMTYVDNLVQGVALAERQPAAAGGAYWVADERSYSLSEIVSTVKAALVDEGYEVAERQTSVPLTVARIAERVDRALQKRGRYNQKVHVLGEMDKTIACDISRTSKDLGYEPAVELREGMRRSIRWCRERGIEI